MTKSFSLQDPRLLGDAYLTSGQYAAHSGARVSNGVESSPTYTLLENASRVGYPSGGIYSPPTSYRQEFGPGLGHGTDHHVYSVKAPTTNR